MKRKERHLKEFTVRIQEDDPLFPIEVVCNLAKLHYWTLRNFLKEGFVRPKKVGKKKMLFCLKDIKKVEYLKYLVEERGVNINGLRVILETEGGE